MSLQRRDFYFLLALSLLVLGIGIGLRDPWPADEPRFVLVAKQMVEHGQYLVPHRGAEIYPDKPPLFMWLLAAAHALTGEWRIAFLLPSLLASLGTIALTFDLALKLWGRRAARLAALMLLFAFQFTYQSKRAQIDPFLVFAITAATHSFLVYALIAPSRTRQAAGWFWAAIGTISKGVGALALLMLPVIALVRRRGWMRAVEGRSPPGVVAVTATSRRDLGIGVLAFIAAAAIWLGPLLYAAATRHDPELSAYVREILLGQTARRYANPDHHFQPWWYFGEVMLTTWLPFVLTWPWALPYAWRQIRSRGDARVLIPMMWSTLVLLFFSLSPGKRDMYILPILPMLCVALAPGMVFAVRQNGFRRLLLGFVWALSLPLLIGGLMAALGEPHFEAKQEAARGLTGTGDALWWMLALVGAVGVIAAMVWRTRYALRACFSLMTALWIGLGTVAYPLLDAHSSGRAIMQRARDVAGPAVSLGLVGWREQNLLQAVGPVAEFGFKRPASEQFLAASSWLRSAPLQRALFAEASSIPACVDTTKVIALGQSNRREWVLLRADALARCALSP
ncbi:MAG: glycosyltransferase family 39 protein [Rhodanobacteraceae bacterium]|nr:glycosyltransferase family 39 protein [Rhodanobacteraceae bacterium]MBP9154419.1 glycosyltransferase family 39 protein [Xanthomonadales bacterium]HQW81709.1 glycosyltransferase family 39 protein [Pseudomonadota bacterium]